MFVEPMINILKDEIRDFRSEINDQRERLENSWVELESHKIEFNGLRNAGNTATRKTYLVPMKNFKRLTIIPIAKTSG